MNKLNLLSIDAWADCCGCDCEENAPQCWTWNSWHCIAKIDFKSEKELIPYLIAECFLKPAALTECEVENDQYNLIVVQKSNREPIFALEYGSKF